MDDDDTMWNYYMQLHDVDGRMVYEDGDEHYTHPCYTDDQILQMINNLYSFEGIPGAHHGSLWIGGNTTETRKYTLVLVQRRDGSIALRFGALVYA